MITTLFTDIGILMFTGKASLVSVNDERYLELPDNTKLNNKVISGDFRIPTRTILGELKSFVKIVKEETDTEIVEINEVDSNETNIEETDA